MFTIVFAFLLAATWARVAAHETAAAGAFLISIGWGEEPAFSGARNSVEVTVMNAKGAPLERIENAALRAEISFGSERVTLPLRPASAPGTFAAPLVPTRPGTYTFRVTGTVSGQAVDVTSTCSETTFDCVRDVSEVQFPAKDPSAGQLAERVSRSIPRAEQAVETARSARMAGFAAIGIAMLALVAAIGLNVRRHR